MIMGEQKTEWLLRHKLSVEAYHRLGQSGILPENDRVELIEGEVIDMSPIGCRHAGIVTKLAYLIRNQTGSSAVVASQNPVHLSDLSEPQPDISVLRARSDFYADSHPNPEDVLLAIEVADTSLRYDREVKLPLYARANIREVWLLDLEAGQLLVNREPANGIYVCTIALNRGETAVSTCEPRISIALSDVFGA